MGLILGRVARSIVVLAVLTGASYAAWLGWDREYDVDPQGVVTGPHQAWQVIGLVVTLGVIAAYAGWRWQVVPAVIAMPAALTLGWSVWAATPTEQYGASLWPIGAFMLYVAALAGVTLVAGAVAAFRPPPR